MTRILTLFGGAIGSVMAGTVVVTSLPDAAHPLSPLASIDGTALPNGAEVSIGAFPGMSDDEILDAATGGLAQITSAFRTFGTAQSIGDGVDGAAGNFEIAFQHPTPAPASVWAGEEVSLLIKTDSGQEFLVLRFKGKLFEVDPATGLEPLLSLHLADAKVIVGNRYGASHVSTSTAPEVGSFTTWIQGFPAITDPAQRMADADADGDGRGNVLEYVTGGNPASPADPPPCQILTDEAGAFWIRFSRAAGIGVPHEIESSADLVSPWLPMDGTIEPDPDAPAISGAQWMKIRVPQPIGAKGFYRLSADP